MFWHRYRCYRKVVIGNRRLAREVEHKMRAELAEGNYFPERLVKRISIEQAAERFLNECLTFKKSTHKVSIYVRGIVQFFRGKALSDITPADVQRFRQFHGQRVSVVSVNHYHRILRRLFYWAAEVGLFKGDNPASGRKVPLANERPYWRTRYLTAEELKTLLEVADPRIRPMIFCATFTGMRLGEIKNMRKIDVDLDRAGIKIPETKTGDPGWVPIPDTLYRVLESVIRALPSQESHVFDFTHFDGLWKQARQSSSLTDVHWHDLRHTYASHLMMRTGNPAVVQSLLRHKTPICTQRYSHLAPGYLRTAALSLDTLLEAPKTGEKSDVRQRVPVGQNLAWDGPSPITNPSNSDSRAGVA